VLGQAYGAATTRPEHHLLRFDRRLIGAITGQKCAVNGDWRAGFAVRYERHHCGPDAA
jgi:hypothetical protein